MQNPTMMFKAPGPHEIDDAHLDYTIVDADEEGAIDAALAEGWFLTSPEAKEAYAATQVAKETNLAPTRAELEAKATELGLTFTGKTSDKKLGDMIAVALEE